jgi:hypothetical protein
MRSLPKPSTPLVSPAPSWLERLAALALAH